MERRTGIERDGRVRAFGSNLEYLAALIGYLCLLARYRCQSYGRNTCRKGEETHVPRGKITQKRVQQALLKHERRVAGTMAEGRVSLPLEQLAKEHGLAPFEKWALAAVVGQGMDDQFCQVMEALVGRRGNREVGTVLALLCEDVEHKIEARRYFISSATLFAHGLLSIGFSRSLMSESEFMRMDLEVPRRIASLILGEYDVDDQLLAFSSVNACFTEETLLNDLNSMNVINIAVRPQLVLAVLNSRLMSYWFVHKFGKLQRGIFPQFKVNELAMFPMPATFAPYEEMLIKLVERILAAKKAAI